MLPPTPSETRGSDTVRWILRILALLLLLAGLGAAGLVVRALGLGLAPASALGRLWYDADPSSLNTLQVVLERHLWPPLWGDFVFPILQQPAPLVAGVATAGGLLLFWLTRRRGGGGRNGKRRIFS
jgi:hypothetical protein